METDLVSVKFCVKKPKMMDSIPKLCFLLFCTVANKCTIISQIITLLHVSTLSCHPQTACDQHLAKLHQYFKCSCQ